MKAKYFKPLFCLLVVLALFIGILPVSAQGASGTDKAQAFIDGITSYNLTESGASSVQEWIDGSIAAKAGSSDWYALALSQYGSYDLSAYEDALIKYLSQNTVSSASSRQKYALALIASGSTDPYIYNTLNDSVGKQGVMSWIFGLHLCNNGYSPDEYSSKDIIQKLLSLQLADGGWAITGKNGDVDTTAMAIQALAPYYQNDLSVGSAVDKALALLSERQQSTGDFASYGVNNPESSAQVLVALSSLGIDCVTDSRFIKNGNSLLDGIGLYQLSDGSFCHKQGGELSSTATAQAFYSMVSYLRMTEGKSGLFILDAADPNGLKVPDNVTSSTKDTASSKAPESSRPASSDGSVTDSSQNTEPSPGSDEPNRSESVSSDGNTSSTEGHESSSPSERQTGSNYKIWVSLAIIVAAGGICLMLWALKKRNTKNFLLVALVAIIAVLFVTATDFKTPDQHYNSAGSEKTDPIGTVTMTIRCDTIPDKSARHIPDDGIVLEVTELDIEAGDTVYDLLIETTAKNRIHLETGGTADSVYVEGINNIYEFDFGDLSGWVYRVNGEEPQINCGEYLLRDKDHVEWLYTCTLSEDLK